MSQVGEITIDDPACIPQIICRERANYQPLGFEGWHGWLVHIVLISEKWIAATAILRAHQSSTVTHLPKMEFPVIQPLMRPRLLPIWNRFP